MGQHSGGMTTTAPAPAPVLRLRDRVLRAAEALTTPLLPEDYLDLVAPLRSGAALRGRIESVRPETADAATLDGIFTNLVTGQIELGRRQLDQLIRPTSR